MKRAVIAALVAWSARAGADELRPSLEQPLVEVSHAVDIRIDDGVAIYKVRRQFANKGKVADEAGLAIDLPSGAAATGLRIRARDRWYEGELMEREKAAALYQKLTGRGAYQPKDPALLQWLWADKLYLQVFPVLPGSTSTESMPKGRNSYLYASAMASRANLLAQYAAIAGTAQRPAPELT